MIVEHASYKLFTWILLTQCLALHDFEYCWQFGAKQLLASACITIWMHASLSKLIHIAGAEQTVFIQHCFWARVANL
jgi:hypothetical protein